MNPLRWLRQLLCQHDWRLINENVWTVTAVSARFRCLKCHKEEGL